MKEIDLKKVLILLSILVAMTGTGCSTWRKLDDTEKGAVIGVGSGAVVGGAVSGSPLGAAIGGAGGGVAGGLIGNEIDKDERRRR